MADGKRGRPPVTGPRRETVIAYPEGLTQCPRCLVYFLPARPRQEYCSHACQEAKRRERAKADQ